MKGGGEVGLRVVRVEAIREGVGLIAMREEAVGGLRVVGVRNLGEGGMVGGEEAGQVQVGVGQGVRGAIVRAGPKVNGVGIKDSKGLK